MKGGKDGCAINPATKRCSKKGTQTPELCELSAKNRCAKVKNPGAAQRVIANRQNRGNRAVNQPR